MSKQKPVCFFCHKEVDIHNEVYYLIEGPDGNKVEVHGHAGVIENGGMKMLRGEPVVEENDGNKILAE